MSPFGIAARGSFRRQIILTFVVGFLGLAVTFAVYMVSSERDKLYRDSREMATGLGRSLAVSSRSWVLANDVVGMQEVVNAFRDYPELRYAMVVSPAGRVLAHSDTTKVGQYVADEKSLALLQGSPGSQIMRDDSDVVDVVVPVEVGERHVGWARVALEREVATNNLYQLAWSVALFVLVVTALFLIAALLVMRRLGRRIDSLVGVARAVQAGNFSTRVAVIPADDDEIVRLGTGLNLMLDVLARNEEKLRASTHYTRSLIEASLDPLVTISPDGKITDVNLATEKVTGRSREELVGTDFSEYFSEPDRARAGYQKVFAQGEVTDYPLAIRHRDGHVTEVLYNASIYRNEGGAVQGVFAAARDVSGQQRAELLQAQLAAIVESSNDAIIGKTLEGTITSWNKGAEKIYGYRAEEIIGKSVTLMASAEQHAEMHRLLEIVRNGGTVENCEAERMRKDGTRIHVALTLSPIRDAFGKISGISTIAREISEQKRMELERAENLRYFESMDRVDRAMQQAKDLEGMLSDVLGEVLDIFACDRVGLVYPCDPASPNWQIVMERAKPGYSTESQRGMLPMTEIRADSMRWLLEASGPVQFTPVDDPANERFQNFGIRSFMSMAVRPRVGSAWEFGIHQCTHARSWNAQESKLFEEIARRLADGLSTMLVNRDLRASEQRYRLVFENSPVSIWEEDFSTVKTLLDELKKQGMTDLDAWFAQHPETLTLCAQATKILDVNSAAIGLHRAPDKECLLAELLDTFTPESFDTFRRELVCLWSGGTQMAEDTVVRTLGGELRNVTIYFTVCPGYEATWGKVIVSLVDITDRKQAEEQIRQSETKYRTLIQNIQAAVVVHAPDTRILISNSQAQEILGLSKEQLAGKSAIDPDWHFFREDGKPAPLGEYPVNRVLATGQAIRSQVMGVHRPGREADVWVLANADPIFGKDGTIAQIIVTFIDISERKQAEVRLARMNERISLAARAAELGVWDWNLQKNELVWDDRMYELYGVRREDFTGAYEAWLHGIHPDDRAASDEISKQAQRGEREYDTEFRVVWPDGSIHYLKAYGRFVRDTEGKPLRMTGVNFDITERKQAEEALRREQTLLNRIMVTSPVGIAVVSKEGQITFANPQAERILGLSKEQITQLSYNAPEWHSTAIDGGPFPDEAQPFSRVMATGQPVFDVQHAIAWPDGRRVLLSINGAPLFNARGEIEGVAFAIEDITERKQADETLRRSEHGLSEAQRIAHLGNWELDLVKNVLSWSDEIYRIFEIDPKKFGASYEAFLNAIHPEDRDMVNKAYTDSVKNKVPYDIVHRLQMPDGRIKYVNEKCETYYGADGAPSRSVGTVHDITERKLDELALLEQQQHSNSLLHLSRRLERAQSYADILTAAGDEVRELVGYRNLWVYLLSDDRQYFTALIGTGADADRSVAEGGAPRLTIAGDQMLEQIARAKEIVIIEDAQTSDIVNREIVRKIGNRTIVNIPIILFDRHLGAVGVGTFGDEGIRVPSPTEQKYLLAMASHMAAALDRIYQLNERRKVEQEVQELNRDLEQRVDERTEQLAAANKELEAFSYSVSHDLRSPLRAIDGFSHLLLEDYNDKLDDEGKRMLGIVRDNTTRMGQLIDDILKFSRSGRSEINAVEVDMAVLAREVLDELQIGVAKVAGLHCEIGELPPVNCDRAMMHQVFANLISNALKFSRTRETPTIEVGGSIQGDEIVYHVKDNGVGFDMQYADKLFGVFQRLHSMEEFEGTGIGLAIVKRIVIRHGGRVWAESKVNEGATVYFALPQNSLSGSNA